MISGIEKAQIKSRLLSLSIEKLKEVAKTVQLPLKADYSLNELADYITEKVVARERKKEDLSNLVDYFQIADKIEHKTIGLTKQNLGKILKIKVGRNTNRDSLITLLRDTISSGKINIDAERSTRLQKKWLMSYIFSSGLLNAMISIWLRN